MERRKFTIPFGVIAVICWIDTVLGWAMVWVNPVASQVAPAVCWSVGAVFCTAAFFWNRKRKRERGEQ